MLFENDDARETNAARQPIMRMAKVMGVVGSIIIARPSFGWIGMSMNRRRLLQFLAS